MNFKTLSLLFAAAAVIAGCNQQPTENTQTYTSGCTQILVDESLAPIVEDQLYVFESSYPQAKIQLVNKPENELLKLFLNDSIRIAVLSRELKPEEAAFYERKKIKVRVNRFAIDGVALITHNSTADTSVNVADVIGVMQGKPGKIKKLIFDNPNSSTVRYLKELAGIKQLPTAGVYALKSNPDVIKYVRLNPGTVGVVGINWIEQPTEELEPVVADLKVLSVKNLPGKPGSDGYYRPSQNDIATGMYPLTRNLYIINCQGRAGLGTGFASFLASDRGQRIVLKSGLLPDSIPPREVLIRK